METRHDISRGCGCVSDVSIMEVDVLERHMDCLLNDLVPVLLRNSLIYERQKGSDLVVDLNYRC
jgi:hypothetical protein